MERASDIPRVSVLMPTFKQGAFIRRALESLRAQTLTDWELIVVDDGSPDDTGTIVAPYLQDRRVRYVRLDHNRGLGAALNLATSLARGKYLAYLPSDDLYYPDHLARLSGVLDARPECFLAYGGVRWGYEHYGPTLAGESAVGREAEALMAVAEVTRHSPLPSGNILALVQVMCRREPDILPTWPTREEVVSDTIERDFWRALGDRGACFAYAGAITCEWLAHPHQRHVIIAGAEGGLARYRIHYGVGHDEWVNWQPSRGPRVDERARYERFAVRRTLPSPSGLRILMVGELGFNPERIVALEEQGHKLYGLWIPEPESWDAVGPLPYGNVEDVPFDANWRERVTAIRPDLIYALLNWQALPLIDEVVAAKLGLPVVFHFKEGPSLAHVRGRWAMLMRILQASDGQIFISEENRDWFQLATDGGLDPEATLILDGDPPKLEWMTDEWSPKLSDRDGEIHTVCPGRPLGLDPFDDIAEAGIHVHFYGEHFHQNFPNWTRAGLATGMMHIHPTVEPSDWVRELSRYDAAWFHVFRSVNDGDLRRANWDDLNLPARLGTFAAAGLPWILKDNSRSRVAVQSLARRYDVGLFFTDFADLGRQLRDRRRVAELTANMRAARYQFAFDTHVPELSSFFHRIIERYRSMSARA